MIQPGTVVEFDRKKQFTHVQSLGEGGTGDTHLFKDDTTDMLFAFKKYSPKDTNYIDEHYQRFVDEIKILFKLSHPNIVRVYNYYLYPEYKLGYLQMEYIDGATIADFKPDFLGKSWVEIFTETISAFEYLEMNKILHRDIRPANIMIDNNGNVKVIDFGFGKKLTGQDKDGRSVFLNWPVSQLPEETNDEGIYNHQTEIYFLGKLFSNILGKEIANFKFEHIIDKMVKLSPFERYLSFHDIAIDISQGVLGEINFTKKEKEVYRGVADILSKYIYNYINNYEPINDLNITMSRLAILIRNSSLEHYIQDNSELINCFINGKYSYNPTNDIELSIIIDFYQLLQRLVPYKQKIVLDNINMRLSKIKVEIDFDELPF
ncbi:protein kinase family protein [Heyndrickxia sporothermodurans]|uniref:protein kinase family protein n=1 Tax=Heyndrickxia sporothermodurans TaxID=46224 RepID=UPI002E1AAFF1|nr:protein kinase family protein [Heyndrickxia sporothermodurans]MED3654297.1 protein kinase family protein [Heyndrickxia sporothermodurans]MED3700194.1 protein kinase family protein [Heyndrickxia sporothermodurans]